MYPKVAFNKKNEKDPAENIHNASTLLAFK
jgi:hypothetical protein